MFGNSSIPGKEDAPVEADSATANKPTTSTPTAEANSADKKSGNGSSSPSSRKNDETNPPSEKKRRSSGVSRARDMFTSAKQSLHLHGSPTSSNQSPEKSAQTPIQKLSKTDPALNVPQGSLNNSAGESMPGPRSTFRVGVTEDKNKKCRRTMEDTHAYLYNFLSTPGFGPEAVQPGRGSLSDSSSNHSDQNLQPVAETDNGYFAIFDGHAGTFAADWCGKKLHLLLEDAIRKNPNTPIPELLDQTFTAVDQQLEKLPLKNSGCTAVIAVLRWEDRIPSAQSSTGSVLYAPSAVAAAKGANELAESQTAPPGGASSGPEQNTDTAQAGSTHVQPEARNETAADSKLRSEASRQRVLYTANVGDARIVLCRNGRALRLSYDHKGSDENEGRRVASAGGLILNNRVNGVLAVTRALGDAYMKDLVTGHPYTTETVIQPDQDEFLILACDGLWDVCSDQEAVDLVRHIQDPQAASKQLVDHALARFSTDNLSCMIVRFDNHALKQRKSEALNTAADVVDSSSGKAGISEADAIVSNARKHMADSGDAVENANPEGIIEEEEEPGPELNPEALKSAQKNG